MSAWLVTAAALSFNCLGSTNPSHEASRHDPFDPLIPSTNRRLSAFFAADGFGVGAQTDYQSPSAMFDKAARRFVLAAVSHGDAAAGGNTSSVLWLGASVSSDPRQMWRMAALAAPAKGDPSNPCSGDRTAV